MSAISTNYSSYASSSRNANGSSNFLIEKKIFKPGYVFLNGQKVKICANLKNTERCLNKVFRKTKIRAKIASENSKKEPRLVLEVIGGKLDIHDPKRILSDIYRSNKISTKSDALIQITRKNQSSDILIRYLVDNQAPFPGLGTSLISYKKVTYLKGSGIYDNQGKPVENNENKIENNEPTEEEEQGLVAIIEEIVEEVNEGDVGGATEEATNGLNEEVIAGAGEDHAQGINLLI